MSPAVSGTFVVTATFAGEALFGVALPLLLTYRQVHAMTPDEAPSPTRPGRYGDLWLHGAHEHRFLAALQDVARRYLVLHGGRVAMSALAAAFLRRHLMAWKIFCPRFVLGREGCRRMCC